MRNIGAAFGVIGGAILAPLGAAVRHFAEVGSDLADMSSRTGLAASRLAKLKFAADQTGTSIEDVELAIKHAAKQGFSPERFEELGISIARIKDPMARLARVTEVFGKSGSKLLPMFMELAPLLARARSLGIGPSPQSVALADKLGDAFTDVAAAISAVAFEVGAALAPALVETVKVMLPIIKAFNDFVRANPGAVTALAALGVALGVIGGALLTAGAALAGFGVAVGGMAIFLTEGAAIVGAIVAGLMAIGVVVSALAFAFFRWSGIGRITFDLMINGVKKLVKEFGKVFEDIGNAIRGGNIGLAWEIVLMNMEISWHKFAKTIFLTIAKIEEAIVGGALGALLKSEISIASVAREAARGQDIDAKFAELRLRRMGAKAATGARGAEAAASGSQNQPGGGATGATVTGFSPFAAILGRQIIGGGRNSVNDSIQRLIKQDEKHHQELIRNLRAAGVFGRVR